MTRTEKLPQQALDALADGLTTVAVTGTNGKTTTVAMLAAIARAAGQHVAQVTTLGMWVDDEQLAEDGSMASFVRTVRRAREVGACILALEVTSRALEGGFARRWPATVAAFTNLTPDHLDRHGTPERYLAAKAQLFVTLPPGGTAVLNACDPASDLLAEVVPSHARVRRYAPRASAAGHAASTAASPCAAIELSACGHQGDAHGVSIALSAGPLADALGGELHVPRAGDFHVDDALCAALAAAAAGLPADAIRSGLASYAGVEGRFQIVADAPMCIVDFAHTPDALERVLCSARALAAARDGRLACVFGCGGERDPGKRAPMGQLADRLADAVWLTTDNPRNEAAEVIAAAVRSGMRGRAELHEIADRAAAIAAAVAWARERDVVLVAGRGNERVQLLASGPVPSFDVELVHAALAGRGH